MPNQDQNTEQQAWQIASDPSAPEAKWLAAMTVLEGKNAVGPAIAKTPNWLALPWSLFITGCGTAGAVVMFALTQLIICSKISEVLAFAGMASNVSVAVCIWLVPCLVFSMLFTYQRLMFAGGKSWQATQWTLVLGYLSYISITAIAGHSVEPWDAGLLAMWNIACLAIAACGTKLAEHSYKGLEQTIGARKVIIPMMRSFAIIPVILGAAIFLGVSMGLYIPPGQLLIGLGLMALGASYLTVKQLNASRTSTARSISIFLWGPFILANILLLPAIAVTHLWLSFTGTLLVNWIDYAGAFTALLLSIATPIAGGALASKHLQARAALGLARGDARRSLSDSDHSLPPLTAGSAETLS